MNLPGPVSRDATAWRPHLEIAEARTRIRLAETDLLYKAILKQKFEQHMAKVDAPHFR